MYKFGIFFRTFLLFILNRIIRIIIEVKNNNKHKIINIYLTVYNLYTGYNIYISRKCI